MVNVLQPVCIMDLTPLHSGDMQYLSFSYIMYENIQYLIGYLLHSNPLYFRFHYNVCVLCSCTRVFNAQIFSFSKNVFKYHCMTYKGIFAYFIIIYSLLCRVHKKFIHLKQYIRYIFTGANVVYRAATMSFFI